MTKNDVLRSLGRPCLAALAMLIGAGSAAAQEEAPDFEKPPIFSGEQHELSPEERVALIHETIGLTPNDEHPGREDRPDRMDRPDRPQRPDRPERPERPEFPVRVDRPEVPVRPDIPEQPARPEQPVRPDLP